jgi:multiubiquitin
MPNKPPKQITITINGTRLTIDDGEYTGAQLKELGHVPAGETLYLKHGQGKEDPIADTDTVKVHPNMVFVSAPDGGVS